MSTLHVVGAPSSAGSFGVGQERTPQVLREHGLLDRLRSAGLDVVDHGDVARARMREDPDHPEARLPAVVAAVATLVAEHVAEAIREGGRVLVIGGDCTVQLGTTAGLSHDGSHVGVAYVDLDADLNTPATGEGALDWMGVAHLLGLPGTVPQLTAIGGRSPALTPADLVLLASDRRTEAEQRALDELGLRVVPMPRVEAQPAEVAREVVGWAEGLDRLSVHVDVDVLDQRAFRIAHEERDVPGLSVGSLEVLLAGVMASPHAAALTVSEINPDRPADLPGALDRVCDLLVGALTAGPTAG